MQTIPKIIIEEIALILDSLKKNLYKNYLYKLIHLKENNMMIAGDIENEDEILEWLLSQLEKDEIEDVTDEMLDRLIKDGKTLAVLFCKLLL